MARMCPMNGTLCRRKRHFSAVARTLPCPASKPAKNHECGMMVGEPKRNPVFMISRPPFIVLPSLALRKLAEHLLHIRSLAQSLIQLEGGIELGPSLLLKGQRPLKLFLRDVLAALHQMNGAHSQRSLGRIGLHVGELLELFLRFRKVLEGVVSPSGRVAHALASHVISPPSNRIRTSRPPRG